MGKGYLHNHLEFKDLLSIVAEERGIEPYLVEKDYWIMQSLYGLRKLGFQFELKGGTSLSKGFNIIDRFSEDIDIHIHPPKEFCINENPKNTNPNNSEKRFQFFEYLAKTIVIDGIVEIVRDHNFDDTNYYRSGGIRMLYNSHFNSIAGVKEGVLLEVGFDNVNPNIPIDVSSWALDKALKASVDVKNNIAVQVPCYHMGYTFVEKLQTIVTKYRNMIESGNDQMNFMRQYYDVYHLLRQTEVLEFINTLEYSIHKENRFPQQDFEIPLIQNQAFLLNDSNIKAKLISMYNKSASLYYNGQPDFESILKSIQSHLHKL